MQEQSFEQMLNETLKEIHPGQILKGTVISVQENRIALNIGYKADGIVKRQDYSSNDEIDLRTVVNVGDELEVKVKKINDGEGQVVLSRRELIQGQINDKLKALYESGELQKGKVIKVTDGGLTVEVEPMVNVFIPRSLISNKNENDINHYLGKELEFYITEFNIIKRRVIGDRKRILVAEEKKKKEEALSKIKEGDIVTGTVKSILDYGVFIDVGGVDGLLHITEMGWGKLKSPRKMFKVGDQVKVLIREVSGDKISLTAKFPEENPWLTAKEKYGIGKTVKGKVARMADYGAFIELEEDIDGLLHVSQISREKIKKPEDVLTIGQEVEVKVIDFDDTNKKISLSMKALLPEPEKEEQDTREIVDVDIAAYGEKIAEQEKEEAANADSEAPVEKTEENNA